MTKLMNSWGLKEYTPKVPVHSFCTSLLRYLIIRELPSPSLRQGETRTILSFNVLMRCPKRRPSLIVRFYFAKRRSRLYSRHTVLQLREFRLPNVLIYAWCVPVFSYRCYSQNRYVRTEIPVVDNGYVRRTMVDGKERCALLAD